MSCKYCKITATATNNLMYPDYMIKWYELSCGHSLTLKGEEAPKWCAVCGKAVEQDGKRSTVDYPPTQCTHYKPRTLEDVLRDFTSAIFTWDAELGTIDSKDTWKDVAAPYADEIRELLGGDSE